MSKKKFHCLFTIRRIVLFVCCIFAASSGGELLYQYAKQRQQQANMTHLTELAELKLEEATYVSPIDFEALRAQNPDVVGWIQIPDTRIDYPILHTENNEIYLHQDFKRNESAYGAIFLDCDSKPDFSSRNNPIYGHHMKDGSMFKDVTKFKEEQFFKEHPYFKIYTPERTIYLKAIACYYGSSDGIVRKTHFQNQEDFDAWLLERLKPCSYAEIPEKSVASVFTLVTCSYEVPDARTMLFAVEVEK